MQSRLCSTVSTRRIAALAAGAGLVGMLAGLGGCESAGERAIVGGAIGAALGASIGVATADHHGHRSHGHGHYGHRSYGYRSYGYSRSHYGHGHRGHGHSGVRYRYSYGSGYCW